MKQSPVFYFMKSIVIKEVHERIAIERAKPKPKVVIQRNLQGRQLADNGKGLGTVKDAGLPDGKAVHSEIKEQAIAHNNILHQLEREYADTRMERDKLSSQIWRMVQDNSTQEQLRAHYEKIESYRIPLQQHYDKIAYVKQHGHLPEIKAEPHQDKSLLELKFEKRTLSDKRCKLAKKLKISAKPSKPEQIAFWQMELEQATARYHDVELKIKKMEGKA